MKRKLSIIQQQQQAQRGQHQQEQKALKKRKAESQAAGHGGGGGRAAGAAGKQQPHKQQRGLRPASAVHQQAAYAVERLLAADATQRGGVTLKGLTLAPHIVAKKATYAVTCEALRHLPALQPLLERTQLLEQGPGLCQAVGCVLAYEVLWGEGLRGAAGPAERAVLAREPDLRRELQRLLEEAGVESVAELLPAAGGGAAARPRTARVNTLRMGVAEALEWVQHPPPEHAKWAAAGQSVEADALLPDLLVFPPGTELHDHPLVHQGALVLQSKASCLPAHALAPQPGWAVLDACAAPGNKTTHLAALMQNRGTLLACDRDPRRLERLRTNAALAGASVITAQCVDFLSLDPQQPPYSGVQALLLDPSCSGSGTAHTRMEHLLPSAVGRASGDAAVAHVDARVEALAQFQEAALRHALSFPAATRLTYSTCSVHLRENEHVVRAVLEEAEALGWRLEAALPGWRRRGVPGEVAGAEKLLRVDPDEDATDGFFLALFVRPGDQQQQEGQREEKPQQQHEQQQQSQKKTEKEKEGR